MWLRDWGSWFCGEEWATHGGRDLGGLSTRERSLLSHSMGILHTWEPRHLLGAGDLQLRASRKKPRVQWARSLGRKPWLGLVFFGSLQSDAPELGSSPLLGSSRRWLLLLEAQEGSRGLACLVGWWLQSREWKAVRPTLSSVSFRLYFSGGHLVSVGCF